MCLSCVSRKRPAPRALSRGHTIPPDPHDLARFLAAQEVVIDQALAELRAGAKRGHWMWFVFPQIAGLGQSAMSRFYAIASADEARAFLAHPVLGRRLDDCAKAVLTHAGRSAESILGPVDATKLQSSMTLFDHAAAEDRPFGACLDDFFGGTRDAATLALLAKAAPLV